MRPRFLFRNGSGRPWLAVDSKNKSVRKTVSIRLKERQLETKQRFRGKLENGSTRFPCPSTWVGTNEQGSILPDTVRFIVLGSIFNWEYIPRRCLVSG
jgi:hypothetical protein